MQLDRLSPPQDRGKWLKCAAALGGVDEVRDILALGAPWKADCVAALFSAVLHGHAEIAEMLLTFWEKKHHGTALWPIRTREPQSGNTLMMQALQHEYSAGQAEAVRLLIGKGVRFEPRARDCNGITLEQLRENNPQIKEWLSACNEARQNGKLQQLTAPPDTAQALQKKHDNAFLLAAAFGNLEKAQAALQAGAHPNAIDDKGRTAPMLASLYSNDPEMQNFLENPPRSNPSKTRASKEENLKRLRQQGQTPPSEQIG